MNDVDVVIPAYNAARYLGEAIDSVLAQSCRASRIVVVDDGSDDATAKVALAAGERNRGIPATDVPVELVRLGDNRGAAAARNAGLAATRSALVAFLDADDRWAPRKLELQCAAFDADPALTFAICRIVQFVSPDVDDDERRRIALDAAPLDGWSASALVARRELFDEIGGFPEALRVGDWFNRARHLPHALIDTVGVERRLHAGNATRRAAVTGRDYLEVVRLHRARLRARGGAGA